MEKYFFKVKGNLNVINEKINLIAKYRDCVISIEETLDDEYTLAIDKNRLDCIYAFGAHMAIEENKVNIHGKK